ncbi:hypothetical protein QRD37_10895 [Bacillus velezensis]|nr:hypothetical protein [Bacillus velezensis]MDL5023765.1 hypothetical protein [Bacillus velezensis]
MTHQKKQTEVNLGFDVSLFANVSVSNLRQTLTSCQTISPYRRNIGLSVTESLRV